MLTITHHKVAHDFGAALCTIIFLAYVVINKYNLYFVSSITVKLLEYGW